MCRKSLRLLFMSLVFVLTSAALPQLATSEEIKLDASASGAVKSNLEKLTGKKVAIRVTSGDEIGGTVQNVGPEGVVITQLTGREFFDALIPIEKIVAVIVRAR